jgi:hypothetical protein
MDKEKTRTTAGFQTPDLPPYSLVSYLTTGAQNLPKKLQAPQYDMCQNRNMKPSSAMRTYKHVTMAASVV